MAVNLNQTLRPKRWDDITGQDDIKDIVISAILTKTFPSFSIFYGPTGVGKSCIAELAAQTLICRNPVNGNPCGKCEGCMQESKIAIKKFNMAEISRKRNVLEVLDEIFNYQTMTDTAVYILEEVQTLKQNEDQAPFLEELTKIPSGVYIMMCTTNVYSLSKELRNRAIEFQLTVPNTQSCIDLVAKTLNRINCQPISKSAMETLARLSDNTPRSIIKHIELLVQGDKLEEDKIQKFFKTISKGEYVMLLKRLISEDVNLYLFVKRLKELNTKTAYTGILSGLKNFILSVVVELSVGSIETTLTRSEKNELEQAIASISEKQFLALVDQIGAIKYGTFNDENSALYELIKLKLFAMNIRNSNIVEKNNELASATRTHSFSRTIENKKIPTISDSFAKTVNPVENLEHILGHNVDLEDVDI